MAKVSYPNFFILGQPLFFVTPNFLYSKAGISKLDNEMSVL